MAHPLVTRAVLGALLTAAAACGGGSPVPADTAERLTVHAEAVVTALEAGDGCAAADQAEQLRRNLEASAERIEPATLEQLRAATEVLAGQVSCDPAPEPAEDPGDGSHEDEHEAEDDEDKDRGKGKDEDKDEGKDEDKDEDKDEGKGRGREGGGGG